MSILPSMSSSLQIDPAILDEHLNWHAGINFLANQLRPIAGLLYRVSSCLPMDVLLLISNSFVNSNLSYCIEILGNAPAVYLNKLFLMQKKRLFE